MNDCTKEWIFLSPFVPNYMLVTILVPGSHEFPTGGFSPWRTDPFSRMAMRSCALNHPHSVCVSTRHVPKPR